MIDPIVSLAFSLHNNPGAYSLLLGSGVSRAASIPTGWEIVSDLALQLARLEGEDDVTDAIDWYRRRFGEEPDYSKILESLAPSREERQRILRGYIEPTSEEREEGIKVPTAAHRAIAELCVSGKIRVVVTTNFDRLLERAIEDLGKTPSVLSTADSIKGALPLVHQDCCIIKVHGDYLDTRIRNTSGELEKYEESVESLLDRVFDDFGVIACGWSATWDPALCEAIERAPNRRFTFYWTSRGPLTDTASTLVNQRKGTAVSIQSADQFFSDLVEKTKSLEELDKPHPLSVKAASASVKRYLSDSRQRIRLRDLVREATENAYAPFQEDCEMLLLGKPTASQAFESFLDRSISRLEILSEICVQGGLWCPEAWTIEFSYPIERLAYDPNRLNAGHHCAIEDRAIPSIYLMYLSGIAALANDNYPVLAGLLSQPKVTVIRGNEPLLKHLNWPVFRNSFKQLSVHEQNHVAASEWLYARCKEKLGSIIPNEVELESLFNRFEIIRSVFFVDLESADEVFSGEGNDEKGVWGPSGRFSYLSRRWNRDRRDDEFEALSQNQELKKGLLAFGNFGGNIDTFDKTLEKFSIYCKQQSTRYF
ncbi:SIR2 family protein [Neorhodopirellula lusitana]|uniref:SIR2 family protein n=1 Tax=Neorhodopirellula lusitana TaxID=445327 RepID=UPI00384E82C8